MGEKITEYIAFISYRHKPLDKEIAKKVHTMIEHYTVPGELRAKWGSKKLGKVFRDEEELPVSSNLTENIQNALDHSRFLIVICTPDTKESIWVEREIKYFISNHGRDQVVAILVDGTPEQSFPTPLTTIYAEDGVTAVGEIEPLAANLTGTDNRYVKGRLRREAVRLYAALLQCPFDSLWQREKRYHMRNAIAIMVLALVIVMAYSTSIFLKNREITARNLQIEEQNEQIKAQYNAIQDMNEELQISEAQALINEAELLYEKGDTKAASERAMKVIASKEGKENYRAEAEFLINRSRGYGLYDNTMRTTAVLEQDERIDQIRISNDGKRVYTMSNRGYVGCYSADDASLIWNGNAECSGLPFYEAARERLYELPDLGLLLCLHENSVAALSLEDGSTVWHRTKDGASTNCDFAVLSPDQKSVIVLDREGLFDTETRMLILDVSSGEVQKSFEMPERFAGGYMKTSGRQFATFSQDGRYLFGMLYDTYAYFYEGGFVLFKTDLEQGTTEILAEQNFGENPGMRTASFTIGIHYDQEEQALLILLYDATSEEIRMERYQDEELKSVNALPILLPQKELAPAYASNFVPSENGIILASCGELSMLYRANDGELINSEKYSSSHVLYAGWMDEEQYTRSFLSDDGYIYALYYNSGYAIGQFADKIHITLLTVTPGYAINHGECGYVLNPEAVMAVICDDDPTRAYILHPAKDHEIEEVEWDFLSDSELVTPIETCDMTDDTTMVISRQINNERMQVTYVDIPSQKKVGQYEIKIEDKKEGFRISDFGHGLYWKDGKHVTSLYPASSDVRIGNLETGIVEDAFADYRSYLAKCARTKQGDILQLEMVSRPEDVNIGENLILLYRLDDQEIRRVDPPDGKKWLYYENLDRSMMVQAGADGYMVIGEWLRDKENRIESFYVCNCYNGDSYEITDEAHGDSDRVATIGTQASFAVTDQDHKVRIYDLNAKCLKQTLHLSVNADEVKSLHFCDGDKKLAVWTGRNVLIIYDIAADEEVFKGKIEYDNDYAIAEMDLEVTEDPERCRIYFITTTGATICIDTISWKKTACFRGLDTFCPVTNEIFRRKNTNASFKEGKDGILRYYPLTLEEMKP